MSRNFDAPGFYRQVLEMIAQHPNESLNLPLDSPGNFLMNYASRTQQLDDILNRLGTRKICRNCKRWEGMKGCCHCGLDHEQISSEFHEFFELQQVEAEGRNEPDVQFSCKYHSSAKGCSLKLFKPPICITYICKDVSDFLADKPDINIGKNALEGWLRKGMIKSMVHKNSQPSYSRDAYAEHKCQAQILFGLNESIEFGRYLLGEIPSPAVLDIDDDTNLDLHMRGCCVTLKTNGLRQISGPIECRCRYAIKIKGHDCQADFKNIKTRHGWQKSLTLEQYSRIYLV